VNFSRVSPALTDLDLAAHGYRIDFPSTLATQLVRLLVHQDPSLVSRRLT